MATSSRSETPARQRALGEILALARTGIDVCDLLAARGEENSDAPRMYLATLERWTRGEESGQSLAARTRALNEWCGGAPSLTQQGTGVDMALLAACQSLVDARADMMKSHGRKFHDGRVIGYFARVTRWVQPDTQEAAECLVRGWLDAHRATLDNREGRA